MKILFKSGRNNAPKHDIDLLDASRSSVYSGTLCRVLGYAGFTWASVLDRRSPGQTILNCEVREVGPGISGARNPDPRRIAYALGTSSSTGA
jgi:hypothetical protein